MVIIVSRLRVAYTHGRGLRFSGEGEVPVSVRLRHTRQHCVLTSSRQFDADNRLVFVFVLGLVFVRVSVRHTRQL